MQTKKDKCKWNESHRANWTLCILGTVVPCVDSQYNKAEKGCTDVKTEVEVLCDSCE